MPKRIQDFSGYQPTRELELFCNALVSQDVMGNKDKAERLSGIDKGRFHYAWKKHPVLS